MNRTVDIPTQPSKCYCFMCVFLYFIFSLVFISLLLLLFFLFIMESGQKKHMFWSKVLNRSQWDAAGSLCLHRLLRIWVFCYFFYSCFETKTTVCVMLLVCSQFVITSKKTLINQRKYLHIAVLARHLHCTLRSVVVVFLLCLRSLMLCHHCDCN